MYHSLCNYSVILIRYYRTNCVCMLVASPLYSSSRHATSTEAHHSRWHDKLFALTLTIFSDIYVVIYIVIISLITIKM